MASVTGIELGPDSCVLVGVRRGPQITALHVVRPEAWCAHDEALAELLRSIRRAGRFPRVANVVAWGLPDGATANDPIARAALRPLVAAGFRVGAVISPSQALASLAATRARPASHGVVWLALNSSGAAVAIVRGAELLFGRAFAWSLRPHAQAGARSELLQRYSLVSNLAPEVERGVRMVAASHGLPVETAVTCGDLPDLRSFTMPLIEELDLEVETLDSADGLRARRGLGERVAEHAPALRLAHAAASAPSRRRELGPLVRVAAAIVLTAFGAWAALNYRTSWRGRQAAAIAVLSRPPAAVPKTVAQSTTGTIAPPSRATAPPGVQVPPGAPVPATNVSRPPTTAAKSGIIDRSPAATSTPPTPTPAPRSQGQPQQPVPVPADRSPGSPPVSRAVEVDRPVKPPPASSAVASPAQRPRVAPVPLKEPMPVLDSILLDGERRLALVGGVIVGVGDRVGPRTVARIDREFVILKEPSGFEVRVPLRQAYGTSQL